MLQKRLTWREGRVRPATAPATPAAPAAAPVKNQTQVISELDIMVGSQLRELFIFLPAAVFWILIPSQFASRIGVQVVPVL